MRSPKPYILAETNWKSVKELDFSVAILPWGATEAHNYHLPYATDNLLASYVAGEAAGYAWEKGAKPIVLPCVPFGVNTGQMEIDLCLNMNPSTQYSLLEDIAEVVLNSGIDKLMILNAHGGNNFKQMIRELSGSFPDLFTLSVNWWQSVDAGKYFTEPGDHAGELETSAIQYINPELVLPLDQAGSGKDKKLRLSGFREGWASTQRHWIEVTEDTGVANPVASTPEKGQKHLEACCGKIGEFLVELHNTPNTDMYK
jgi:creatinine amidohydrolase